LGAPAAHAVDELTLSPTIVSADWITEGREPAVGDKVTLQIVVNVHDSMLAPGTTAKHDKYDHLEGDNLSPVIEVQVLDDTGVWQTEYTATCTSYGTADPMKTVLCTVNYTLTQGDIDDGALDIQLLAKAWHPSEEPYTGLAPEHFTIPLTDLWIDKTATPNVLTDDNKKSDGTWSVTYDFDVSYSGNVPLAGVSVEDDLFKGSQQGSTFVCDDGILQPPGAGQPPTTLHCSESFTFGPDSTNYDAYMSLMADGYYTNTASASGTYVDNLGVTHKVLSADNAQATVYVPQLSITKKLDPDQQDITATDQSISYLFDVTNKGGIPLDYISIIDEKLSDGGTDPLTNAQLKNCKIVYDLDLFDPEKSDTYQEVSEAGLDDISLSPGETLQCSATYAVTQEDFADINTNSCNIVNQATAIAYYRTPVIVDGVTDWPTAEKDQAVAVTADPDSVATPVTPQLGLDVEPAQQPFVVTAGQDATYRFTITNTSDVSLDSVGKNPVITYTAGSVDPMPTITCQGETGDPFEMVQGTGVSLGAHEMITCSFTLPTRVADLPGPLTATLQVDGSTSNVCIAPAAQTITSNTAASGVDLAHLAVTKEADKATYSVGDPIMYIVTATNDGDVDLDAALSDQMPAQVTIDGVTCTNDDSSLCEEPIYDGNGLISGSVSIPKGAMVTYTITGTVNSSGKAITNTSNFDISYDDCVSECGSFSATTTVSAVEPAWTISKTADPASGSMVNPGQVITYTVTATSEQDTNGQYADVDGVVLNDDLSSVLGFADFLGSGEQAPTLKIYDGADSPVVSDLVPALDKDKEALTTGPFNLPAGGHATLKYSVQVNSDAWLQTLTNNVTGDADVQPLACASANTTNGNSCQTMHHVSAEVFIDKIDSSEKPLPGASFVVFDDNDGVPGSNIIAKSTPANSSDDSDGRLVLMNLVPDTAYWLVETEAPSGYQVLPAEVKFTVDTEGNVTLPGTDQGDPQVSVEKDTITVKDLTILDTLPLTGSGPGIPVSAIGIGVWMLGGAGVLLWDRRRRTQTLLI